MTTKNKRKLSTLDKLVSESQALHMKWCEARNAELILKEAWEKSRKETNKLYATFEGANHRLLKHLKLRE